MIPSGPSYGVYISQLIRIARICSNYEDFTKRNKLITTRLIKQGFLYIKLVSRVLSSLFLSSDRRVVPRYRGVCVCLFCYSLGCEEGLGEWVEFTSDQRFL